MVMRYNMYTGRLFFFLGAGLMLIGFGLYMMDQVWAGAIFAIIGIVLLMIGFTILRLYLSVQLRRK